jgi:hypothetical protein
MTMHRGVALLMLAVSLLTATCVAGQTHDTRLDNDAQLVRAGMTVGKAIEILGKPSWRGRCGAKMGSADCVSELGYSSSFAPFLPRYIIVRLDGRGRVIGVDTITSP